MGIGILAFGSIAEEPGAELAAAITRRIEVETPFAVEFARSSRTRDGAPTLVPVGEGGAHVPATVLLLDESVTLADARAMLYRRETGRLYDISSGSRVAWIADLSGFAGTRTCLYTALQPNIRPLTADKLAETCRRQRSRPGRRRTPRRHLLSAAAEAPRGSDAADACLRGSGASARGRPRSRWRVGAGSLRRPPGLSHQAGRRVNLRRLSRRIRVGAPCSGCLPAMRRACDVPSSGTSTWSRELREPAPSRCSLPRRTEERIRMRPWQRTHFGMQMSMSKRAARTLVSWPISNITTCHSRRAGDPDGAEAARRVARPGRAAIFRRHPSPESARRRRSRPRCAWRLRELIIRNVAEPCGLDVA